MTYDSSASYSSTSGYMETVKSILDINKPNDEMTDDEIREVIRYIADRAPDTITIDGKSRPGRQGVELMVFLALTEFPEFYTRYELWQVN